MAGMRSRKPRRREDSDEALRKSEERLRLALEATEDGFWDWDMKPGGEVYFSSRVYTMLGHEPGAFPASLEGWRSVVHPDDWPRIMDELRRQLVPGAGQTRLEYRLLTRNGAWREIVSRGRVMETDDAGRPLRLLGTITDVTESRRLEEQFRHAQKMEAVGRLAGGIAHDFNNLLTAVLGFAEIARGRLDPSHPAVPALGEIRKAAERAADLTRQLLTFSRRQVLRPTAVDLNTVVEGVRPILHRLLGERIELRLDLAPSLSPVVADAGQLEQVLIHLAMNARDAMPEGGVLAVATRSIPGPPVSSVLEVRDTGVGIPPEVVPHIFEPFFTTKRSGEGTGLGLATVFGIVQQSGGTIAVESERGRGATFRIDLPAAEIEDGTPARRRPVEARAPRPASDGRATILLAEDDDAVREIVEGVLRRAGYRVLGSADPETVLEIGSHRAERVDLLVTDVVMPRMEGTVLAKRLRGVRPGLKVLFVSGYPGDPVALGLDAPSETDFLAKPFQPDQLVAAVGGLLGRPDS